MVPLEQEIRRHLSPTVPTLIRTGDNRPPSFLDPCSTQTPSSHAPKPLEPTNFAPRSSKPREGFHCKGWDPGSIPGSPAGAEDPSLFSPLYPWRTSALKRSFSESILLFGSYRFNWSVPHLSCRGFIVSPHLLLSDPSCFSLSLLFYRFP